MSSEQENYTQRTTMNYERPMSWYDPEPETPADYGWVHEDDLPDFDRCKDMLQGCLEALYKIGDVAKLEDCLEELCHQLNVKFELGTPELEKIGRRDLMQWYLGYQRATIDQMNSSVRTIRDYETYM